METNTANNPLPQKEQLPDIAKLVKGWSKTAGRTLAQMNNKLGKHHNFLQQVLKNRDVRPSLLIALSRLLSVNLFEYYIALLPEPLRATQHEKELLRKIEQLQNELKRVGEERDRYWEVISKQPVGGNR